MPNEFVIQFMGGPSNGLFLDQFGGPKPIEEAYVFETETDAYDIAAHFKERAAKADRAMLSVMAKPK